MKRILGYLTCAMALMSVHVYATPDQCKNSDHQDSLPEDTQLYDCQGWYAGLGLGVSSLEPRIVNLPETLDSTTDLVLPTVFLGYDLNAYWGIEGHYSDQGQATFESGAAIDYSHWGASLLLNVGNHLPGWHVFGKLGFSQLNTELAQGRDDGGVFNYEQLESTQLHLGAGIEYMTQSLWGLRLEALSVDQDTSQLTFSILKRFGRHAGKTRALAEVILLPPEPELEPIPEPEPPAPVVLCEAPEGVLDGVYFVTGSSRLTLQSQERLNAVLSQLKPFPRIEIAVRAHTDSRGSDAYNMQLSQSRAASVRQYLQRYGISNVISQGFGETRPVGDNNTAAGRAKNRRVEVEVLSDECDR